MTRLKWLGATALVLTSLTAIPAAQAAQDAKHTASHARRQTHSASASHAHRAIRTSRNENRAGRFQRRQLSENGNPAYDNGYNDGWDRRDPGFRAADAAGNVVGGAVDTAGAIAAGAVDTAGAIATAPFRDDTYAYDNNYNSGWNYNGWNNGWNNNGWNNGYNNQAAYYDNGYHNGWDRRDPAYRAADAAGNVVGGAVDTAGALAVGAVDTAGAIATAPFRGDAFASYNPGWNDGYNHVGYDNSYAARNGFVCQPGTWFKGEDGRRHICQ